MATGWVCNRVHSHHVCSWKLAETTAETYRMFLNAPAEQYDAEYCAGV